MTAQGSGTKGCMVWGCVTVLALLLLAAGVIGLLTMKARTLRNQLTATEPAVLPVDEPPAQKARQLNRSYSEIKDAIRRGSATSLTLTGEELNQAIASVPELAELRGRTQFRIEGNRLKATASIPLDPIPGLAGRYLNGDFDLQVTCEDGLLEIYATGVTVKGKPLPNRIMNQLRRRNLAEELYRNPDAISALKHIESVRVENGTLTIATKKSN